MLEAADDIIEVQKDAKLDDVEYVEIKDPYGFVYITTNLINGKRYIGQKSFNKKDWPTYLGSGNVFRKALNKYGKENFSREIVLICETEDELNQAEYDLSVFFDVVESSNWYNLVLGGGGSRGWHPSEETRKRMSEAAKGKIISQETRQKMSDALRGEKNHWYGKHHTEENKKHQSEVMKGRYIGQNNPMYGIHRTGINSTRFKPIFCIELQGMFWGAREAEALYNIAHQSIAHCLKGKINSAGKHPITREKLHWLYAKDAVEQGYITQQNLDNYLKDLKEKEIDVNGKTV